jgi:hypothetical protein
VQNCGGGSGRSCRHCRQAGSRTSRSRPDCGMPVPGPADGSRRLATIALSSAVLAGRSPPLARQHHSLNPGGLTVTQQTIRHCVQLASSGANVTVDQHIEPLGATRVRDAQSRPEFPSGRALGTGGRCRRLPGMADLHYRWRSKRIERPLRPQVLALSGGEHRLSVTRTRHSGSQVGWIYDEQVGPVSCGLRLQPSDQQPTEDQRSTIFGMVLVTQDHPAQLAGAVRNRADLGDPPTRVRTQPIGTGATVQNLAADWTGASRDALELSAGALKAEAWRAAA